MNLCEPQIKVCKDTNYDNDATIRASKVHMQKDKEYNKSATDIHPIEIITGQIKVINKEIIIATNKYDKDRLVMIFIPKENINNYYWDEINQGFKNKINHTFLVKGEFIKVQIIDKIINQTKIKSIGKLF